MLGGEECFAENGHVVCLLLFVPSSETVLLLCRDRDWNSQNVRPILETNDFSKILDSKQSNPPWHDFW